MKITNNVRLGNPVVSLRANGWSLVVSLRASETSEAIFFRLLRHFVSRNDGRRNLFVLLVMTPLVILLATLFYFTLPSASADDWPQVQHDPQHTGYSDETFTIDYNRLYNDRFRAVWTYPFQPERVNPNVQAIIYNGKVFVGTEMGKMYAFDAYNPDPAYPGNEWTPGRGKILWTYNIGKPILNSVAADSGKVFFGALDGAIYALNVDNGSLIWKNKLSKSYGFTTAPVLAEGKVLVGGQDGYFYALDQNTGSVTWKYQAGVPILQTAAYNRGSDGITRAFFGAMDMYVYALNVADGSLSWKSPKINGQTFKDYWPMVFQGKVLVRPYPKNSTDGISPSYPFGWQIPMSDTFWNFLVLNGPTIASGNLTQISQFMRAQDDVMNRYQANTNNFTKNLYVLDEKTGQEAMAAIHWDSQTHSGTICMPCVDRNNYLVVPVDFIGSGWGRLDLNYSTGPRIVDLLYDGRNYQSQPIQRDQMPAGFGNPDEDLAPSCARNVIFGTHHEEASVAGANYNGVFDLDSRQWTRIPGQYVQGEMIGGGGVGGPVNPTSISSGHTYHIVFHELVVRVTK